MHKNFAVVVRELICFGTIPFAFNIETFLMYTTMDTSPSTVDYTLLIYGNSLGSKLVSKFNLATNIDPNVN